MKLYKSFSELLYIICIVYINIYLICVDLLNIILFSYKFIVVVLIEGNKCLIVWLFLFIVWIVLISYEYNKVKILIDIFFNNLKDRYLFIFEE